MPKARRKPKSSPSEDRPGKLPLHGSRIEDYAIIGDCETAALVSKSGSIDWLCLPTFSSAACFAALLGTADHGYWKIAPSATVISTHRTYAGPTMVLETTFETRSGAVKLIDFMPARGEDSNVIRIVRGLRGKVKWRPRSRSVSTTVAPCPG